MFAVASGKGGVGKSSVTVNLAAALAASGQQVGVLDADMYGFSVPRMLGVTGLPTQVEKMIMPPSAHGVKVISVGMFTKANEPVPWRGPILHRALEQFLGDVFWGDLDVLLLDLPPGTGDVAISVGHLLPNAELLVVTTPQLAAAEVAERAGALAPQLHQQVAGVIENMSYLPCPHCGDRIELYGSGGGQAVADELTKLIGTRVPLLGQVPQDIALREGGDAGLPLVLSNPDSEAAKQLTIIADQLAEPAPRAVRAPAGPHTGLGAGPRPPARSRRCRTGAAPPGSAFPPTTGTATASRPSRAAAAVSSFRSSSRCLRTKFFGCRSAMSKSLNSGPRFSRRSAWAPSARRRSSRMARPAWAANFGSWSGPKISSASTPRTSSLGRDRSNTVGAPASG